jgi:hypothetical protein
MFIFAFVGDVPEKRKRVGFTGKLLAIAWVGLTYTSLLEREVRVQVGSSAPLPALVAITCEKRDGDIVTFVKSRIAEYASGKLGASSFPLVEGTSDTVRVSKGLRSSVVVKWFDPLTSDTSPAVPRYGANNDYIAYFGDGWSGDWKGDVPGSAPQFNGNGKAGWVWVNHEYVANALPTATSVPTGQHLTFAKHLVGLDILTNDVTSNVWSQIDLDTYIKNYKKEVGGSWFRIVQDPQSGIWSVDRSAKAVRYDATSNTLARVTGYTLKELDHDDVGTPLPVGVVAGISGNCSGGQTPWGTIISAEENVQDYYGDLEACWESNQKFVAGTGFDPGQNLSPALAASAASEFGRLSDPNGRHNRETQGFLVEIDPGVAPNKYYTSVNAGGDGTGHRKIGALGRARWENATFVVDKDWKLVKNQPIVMYAGNDRRGGRLYKWVSKELYREDMTRGQIRALLDEGTLFVAHFGGLDNKTGNTLLDGGKAPTENAPGRGQWIHLSVNSVDIAPNAAALGDAKKTVGAALKDMNWNGIGGFPTDDDVRRALFTAEAKVGVMELNRPEDLEWNPKDPGGKPRLYIAFTNHTGGTQLDQSGKLLAPTVTDKRNDADGEIFALQEVDSENPAASRTFTYFQVWKGSAAAKDPLFEAANPDNILIDREGGVWFGTDGNFGRKGGRAADCVYYLDLDLSHREGPTLSHLTYGKAFRIACVASDAEATGPAFSSDQKTLFLSVQHPGEDYTKNVSSFPQPR